MATTNTFKVGEIVKGRVCGTFSIVKFREIDGDTYAVLKEVCAVTGGKMPGSLNLPLDAIRKA
jgi:exosome complex RNA-binding protein Csl4